MAVQNVLTVRIFFVADTWAVGLRTRAVLEQLLNSIYRMRAECDVLVLNTGIGAVRAEEVALAGEPLTE